MIYIVAIITIIIFIGFFPLFAANVASIFVVGGGAMASHALPFLVVMAIVVAGYGLVKWSMSQPAEQRFKPEGKSDPIGGHVFNANLAPENRPDAPTDVAIEQGEFWNAFSASNEMQTFYRDRRRNRILVKPKA
ncbi:hypothetical protein [Methylorubrum zatmanii]